MRPAERGQALLETAIFLPIFLLGLYGVLWSVRQGALAERVQLGVRYGGVITGLADPYDSYSLYALYATIDGHPPTGVAAPGSPAPCIGPDPTQVTAGRASFWNSASATPVTGACTAAVVTISSPQPFSQPIIVQANFGYLLAEAPAQGYLAAGAFAGESNATEHVAAQQNFFRSPDVGTLVQCTRIGAFVKASLEPASDTSSPNPATPMPMTVPNVTVFQADNTCSTFAPVPTPAPPTAPPSTPTPSPTGTPASPQPTLTPPATATPQVTGSASPTPTTTPVPSAPPTVAPTASPTQPPGGGF